MKKKFILFASTVFIFTTLAGCSSAGTYSKYVTLGDYKGLEIEVVKSEVTEDMVNEELDALLEECTTQTPITDRPAEEGDLVNIDFDGKIDGETFEDGAATAFEVELGDGYFLEEIETALIGTNAGDSKEIPVTFSEEYEESLAGKTAIFTVKVNSISVTEYPTLDDAFIKEHTDFSTVATYTEYLRTYLLEVQEEDNHYNAGSDALTKAVENAKISGYPQDLYDSCQQQYDELNRQLSEQFGIDVADIEVNVDETKSAIEEMVYSQMVAVAIAEKEKITVSDKDYLAYLDVNYELYGFESTADYEATYTKEVIMQEILNQKVQDFLVKHAKITEIEDDEYLDYEVEEGDEGEFFDPEALGFDDFEMEELSPEEIEALELEELEDLDDSELSDDSLETVISEE